MSADTLQAESLTPLENNHNGNPTTPQTTPPKTPERSLSPDPAQQPKKVDSPKKPESPKKPKPSDFKIQIPRISSRELHSQRAHSPVNELEQRDYLFAGPGAKREPNKLTVKLKSIELEECIKRAKKYAMEQSVRFVLVKQQQQQQKQQLDLIKKQQALLLMCRYAR